MSIGPSQDDRVLRADPDGPSREHHTKRVEPSEMDKASGPMAEPKKKINVGGGPIRGADLNGPIRVGLSEWADPWGQAEGAGPRDVDPSAPRRVGCVEAAEPRGPTRVR